MNYYIAKKEHYYSPDPDKFGWVEDPESNDFGFEAAQAFESIEVAQAWIDEEAEATYRQSHNEYSRPDYKILAEQKAEDIAAIWSHEDMGSSYYDWDFCEDPENPTHNEEIAVCNRANEKAWDECKSVAPEAYLDFERPDYMPEKIDTENLRKLAELKDKRKDLK